MNVPEDLVRPLWWNYRVYPPAGQVTVIGTLDGLKLHTAVEHDEDDGLLGTFLSTARQMVGDYTRWPMTVGPLSIDVRYPWPLPYLESPSRFRHRSYRYSSYRYSSYGSTPHRPRLFLPGPCAATPTTLLACEYHGGQFDPGEAVGTEIQLSDRLPHAAWTELPADWDYETEIDELAIRYPLDWTTPYPTAPNWPPEVETTIYRVAATLYLYREATMPGDRPLHRIMQATLGPYLPVPI